MYFMNLSLACKTRIISSASQTQAWRVICISLAASFRYNLCNLILFDARLPTCNRRNRRCSTMFCITLDPQPRLGIFQFITGSTVLFPADKRRIHKPTITANWLRNERLQTVQTVTSFICNNVTLDLQRIALLLI